MNDIVQRPSRVWEVLCHLSALSAYVGVPFGHVVGSNQRSICVAGQIPQENTAAAVSSFQAAVEVIGHRGIEMIRPLELEGP